MHWGTSGFMSFLILLVLTFQAYGKSALNFPELDTPGPYRIVSPHPTLPKQIYRHFKDKPISIKNLQKFLIKKDYYQAEVSQIGKNFIIKNPIQIVFVFKGNRFFSEKQIHKIVKVDENTMGAFFYDFVETAIQRAYQNQGFLKVELKRSEFKKKWKKWVYFNIAEGPRIRIAELKIQGLLSQPNEQYENFIKNNSSDLIKKGFYNKKDLEKGYKNLIRHIRGQGYLQSKIYSDRIFFKEDKAFITINLEEGPLIIIQDIQIQNAKALPVWEILSHIQSKVQSTLKVDEVQKDMDRIEQFYKSKGYINIKIKNRENVIQYTPGDKHASLIIKVDEGVKAFVSKISIKGLKKAKKSMVLSLLKIQPGDVLTPLKKERAIKSLGATGLFSSISLNEVAEDPFELEALFKERKLRSIRGGLGLNSQRGLTTRAYSEIAHRNLFGWGRSLIARVSGQVNFNRRKTFLEYDLSGRYKEVFVPGYGYQGDVSLSQSRHIFNYSQNSINFVNKTQISFFINKNLSENLKMRWNVLSFENRRESCDQIICPENPQQISSSSFNIIWDKRDNIFDPSKGALSSLALEWADPLLGSSSDIAFVKADFQNRLYWTFAKNYTLSLTLKGGWIQALRDRYHIPVSRAFILGGKNSIRGYDGHIEGARIPSEKHAPIETANSDLKLKKDDQLESALVSNYGLLNAEFRWPVFKGFKGILFYDIGAVYLKGRNNAVFNYGHSVGVGFRYQTFLIPVGLDIAYRLPPERPKADLNYRFHFSIGW